MIASWMRGVASQTSRDWLRYFSIAGVVLGALVRLVQYLSQRSLWSDEAMLALNILDRSYSALLQPLSYNQAAPPFFLWIEKAAVQFLGNNEYALRLFPFLCGLASLIAFYQFANRYLSPIAAPIAIGLFACLKYVVYYANEVKQYSIDILVTLVLCLLLFPLRHQKLNRIQLLYLGALGAALIWLSHPTVLVLAAIEISYFLFASQQQRWMILRNRWSMYAAWLISLVGLYWFSIRGTLQNDSLTNSWEGRYPDSLLDIPWFLKAFESFFTNPLGFPDIADTVALFAFWAGCVALYFRKRMLLLSLTAPIIITIIAAYLHQYPFRQRLVLFLVPLAIALIAEGVALLFTQTSRYRKPILALGIVVSSILLLPPVASASQLLVYPTKVEELRPVVAYMKAHEEPGDRIYVYRSAMVQFSYYAPTFGYSPDDYVLGKPNIRTMERKDELSAKKIKQFNRDIRSFQGEPRVWFVFCNTSKIEENAFLAIANSIGQQRDQYRQTGALTYLYDLSPAARKKSARS